MVISFEVDEDNDLCELTVDNKCMIYIMYMTQNKLENYGMISIY